MYILKPVSFGHIVTAGTSDPDPKTSTSDPFKPNSSEGSTTASMATHHMAETEPFRIDSEIIASFHDMNDGELLSFAQLQDSQEDSASDEQIELLVCTCLLVFMRMRSIEHLEQAIQRTEGWIVVTATDHPDRARRFQILDMMSAWMGQHKLILEDVTHMLSGNR
jgi:hypothetical protein